jgi:hypothetical protein
MRRTLAGIVYVGGLMIAGLVWWFQLGHPGLRRDRRQHDYLMQNGGLAIDLAKTLEFSVHWTGQAPPHDPQACIKWLWEQDPDGMRIVAPFLDEATGVVYDSLGTPVGIVFRGNQVIVTAAGVDRRLGTADDVIGTADIELPLPTRGPLNIPATTEP